MRLFTLATSALALSLTAPLAWSQDNVSPEAEAEEPIAVEEQQLPEGVSPQAEAEEPIEEGIPADSVEYDADTVLATVNGTDITLGHVAVMVARLPQQYQQIADQDLLDGILQQLVEQQLLKDTLEARGPLDKGLALAIENEVRAMLAQEIGNEFYLEPVSDEAMQEGYQKAIAGIPPTVEYSAAHILVETEDEAKAVIDEVNGGADFAEVAKAKSVGPSGPNGGDLGWFGKGQMVPEFEEAVIALEAGAISAPVQTQFGWHVIKLNETREKPAPSFEDLEERIDEQLRREQVNARLDALKEEGEVEMKTEGFPAAAIRDMSIFGEE